MGVSIRDELPAAVLELLQCSAIAQYATVSAAGVPIDTPVLVFPSPDLATIDLATGLSYPAKAERARRNPRVGLLIEGGPNEPVIAVAGMAAVRDADLQANALRYLSEAAATLPHNPDWSLARKAVWYWTRMLVEIAPARMWWWDSPAAMDAPPQRWDAPAGTSFPQSDPAPAGEVSTAAKWEQRPWQDLAAQAVGRKAAGHLTIIDAQGFPMPLRARAVRIVDRGLSLDMPAGAPWSLDGKACLTFGGIETFIGEARPDGGVTMLRVERTLPVFPMTEDLHQLWEPADHTRDQLMRRLAEETARRGQAVPEIPVDRPEPSSACKRRLARIAAL